MRIDRFSNVGLLIACHPELESLFCRFHSRLDLTDLALSVRGFCEHPGCELAEVLDALRREEIDFVVPVPPPRKVAPSRHKPRFLGDEIEAELAWRDASRDWLGEEPEDEDDGPEPDERSGRRTPPREAAQAAGGLRHAGSRRHLQSWT